MLDTDAIKTVVFQSEAFPSVVVAILLDALGCEPQIVGIVGMDRILLQGLRQAKGVTGPDNTPSGTRPPSVAFGQIELKGAVLQQFGIQATVSR